jgi:Predicted membrane protein (DUF2306)
MNSPFVKGDVPLSRDRMFRHLGTGLFFLTMAGMSLFAVYIILRATGATVQNFYQWHDLVSGAPLPTAADWIANVGFGLHLQMGIFLVLAWPLLFSARLRNRYRTVHRWVGRVYVTAALLAAGGGMSYIFAHGAYIPAASVAFALWGAVMMVCAVMTYLNARAKRFDKHRAWTIRLFAMVLGSWIFDLENTAWADLTHGLGMSEGLPSGPFDHIVLYLFFVPNLLVAEFFIRYQHQRLMLTPRTRWLAFGGLAGVALVFTFAVVVVNGTHTGKYGKHLLSLFSH